MRHSTWCLFFVLLLSACGGGGGDGSDPAQETDTAKDSFPVIQSTSPHPNVRVAAGEQVYFQVTLREGFVKDFDFSWSVDGIPAGTITSSFYLSTSALDPEERIVEVDLSRGGAALTSILWKVRIVEGTKSNSDPRIFGAIPQSPVVLMAGESADLTVLAEDPDAEDSLAFQWSLNGEPLQASSDTFSLNADGLLDGDNLVEVSVTDGKASTGTDRKTANSETTSWVVNKRKEKPENRPPLIQSVAPSSSVQLAAGSSLELMVDAQDPDGDSLFYTWEVNGSRQQKERDYLFRFQPGESEIGLYAIQVAVSDGRGKNAGSASFEWEINVVEPPPPPPVNQPPEIVSAEPPSPVELQAGSAVQLVVQAIDPDGDLLTYRWEENGVLRPETGNDLVFQESEVRLHTVRVTADDGKEALSAKSSFEWQINVVAPPPPPVNQPPEIVSAEPPSPVEIVAESAVQLVVQATDPDGDLLTYRWEENGVPRPETGNSLVFSHSEARIHTVRVTADDGKGELSAKSSFEWQINVLPPPSPPGILTIAWNPVSIDISGNPEIVDGYRIYVGLSSDSCEFLVDVGNMTQWTLTDLSPGVRYYLFVTAYDLSGNESSLSAPLQVEL